MYNSEMFLGLADSTCSTKNQIYYPSKFKNATGEDLFITNWFEYSLIILPTKAGEKIMDMLTDEAVTLLEEGRKLERFLYGGAEKIKVNNEGRFTLPQYLKDHALIQKEVVFRGVGDRIELWSKESYMRYGYLTNEDARDAANNLFKKVRK